MIHSDVHFMEKKGTDGLVGTSQVLQSAKRMKGGGGGRCRHSVLLNAFLAAESRRIQEIFFPAHRLICSRGSHSSLRSTARGHTTLE